MYAGEYTYASYLNNVYIYIKFRYIKLNAFKIHMLLNTEAVILNILI